MGEVALAEAALREVLRVQPAFALTDAVLATLLRDRIKFDDVFAALPRHG